MRARAVLLLSLPFSTAVLAQAVQPDPAKAAPGFRPHQLPFETPKDAVARPEFRSAPFYAVILKTLGRCAPVEHERAGIQELFPRNKVFAPMFECEQEPEDTVRYTNVDPKVGFIAVYAAQDLEDAEEFLAAVNQLGLFPGANLRRMQAVLVYP